MDRNPCFLVALLAWLMMGAAVGAAGELRGRAVVPEGADHDGLRVLLWPGAPAEFEDKGLDPLAQARVGSDGLFALDSDEWQPSMQLEFVGPATRRARFPVEISLVDQPNSRAVFRLEPGARATVRITEDGTDSPLAGVLLGPIFPSPETAREHLDISYPFFVRSDAQGLAVIDGLLPGVDYDAPVFGAGHERSSLRVSPGGDLSLRLIAGGGSIRGSVMGARSARLCADLGIQAVHDESGAIIMRWAGSDGVFEFAGLAPGRYVLRPLKEELGDLPGSEFILARHEQMAGAVLPMPEGVAVDGMVVDIDSGLGLAGARVVLGDQSQATDGAGLFRFDKMMGPWPRRLDARADGYELLEEDQELAAIEVATNGLEDVGSRVIKLRKKRYLDLTVLADDATTTQTAASVVVEMMRLNAGGESKIDRVYAAPGRSVHPLRGALPLLIVGRTAADLASTPIIVDSLDGDTTATATLGLLPAGGIVGSIRYDDGTAPAGRLRLSLPFGAQHVELLTATNEADGGFVLSGLPPSPMRFEFTKADTHQLLLSEDVVVEAGQVLKIERLLTRGKRFAGRVISPDGGRMAGFELRLYAKTAEGAALATTLTTSESGGFALDDLGGATVEELSWEHGQFRPGAMRNIPLPQEDYVITLEPRGGITVKMTGDTTNAEVVTLAGSPRRDALYGSQWFYDVVQRTPFEGESQVVVQPRVMGDLRLAVRSATAWDVTPAFRWDGTDDDMAYSMSPASDGRLSIAVEGIAPEALATAEVLLLNTTLPASQTREPKPELDQTTIRFSNLDPGTHLLVVTTAAGQTRRLENIEIANGEERRAKLVFGAGDEVIAGIVMLESRSPQPIAGVEIQLMEFESGEPRPVARTTSDKAGTFSFDRPDLPGDLLLFARWEGQESMTPLSAEGNTVISFQPTVRVVLRVPPALEQRIAAAPALPLMFSPADGLAGRMLSSEDADKPQSFRPGVYTVSHGESVLGTISIIESNSTQYVELPAGQP